MWNSCIDTSYVELNQHGSIGAPNFEDCCTMSRPRLKTAFKKSKTIAPLHTSGPVAITKDGTRLFTCVAEQALLTDIGSGTEICRFQGVIFI
jgi:hypothetical protein